MGNSLKKGRRGREKAWVEIAKAVTRLEAGEVPFDAGVSGAAQCLAGAALLLREQRENLNDAKAKRARILEELQQKCRDLERKRLCPCFLINVCLSHFKKRKLMRQCAHHANKQACAGRGRVYRRFQSRGIFQDQEYTLRLA